MTFAPGNSFVSGLIATLTALLLALSGAPARAQATPPPAATNPLQEIRALIDSSDHSAAAEKCRAGLRLNKASSAPNPFEAIRLNFLLSMALEQAGKPTEALAAITEANRLAKEHLPADSLGLLETRVQLGRALLAADRPAEAVELLTSSRDTLLALPEKGKAEGLILLACYEPIARSLLALDRKEDAMTALNEWVNAFGQIFGLKHPETAGTLSKIAAILSEEGQFDNAYTSRSKALEGFKGSVGAEHPLYADELAALARLTLEHLLDPATAFDQFSDVLAIYRANKIGQHRLHRALEGALTAAFLDRSKPPPENLPALAGELAELTALLFENPSPEFVRSQALLASALATAGGDHAEAAGPVLDRLIALQDSAPEMKTAPYLSALAAAAPGFRKAGRLDKAEEILAANGSVAEISYQADDPRRIAAVLLLADFYTDLGMIREADRLYVAIYPIAGTTLGGTHPKTIALARRLASTRRNVSRLVEAEQLFRVVLDADTVRRGASSPEAIDSRNGLAITLTEVNKHEEAAPLFEENLTFQRETLGPNHSNTLLTEANLARILNHDRKFEEARDLCLESLGRSGGAEPEENYGRSELLYQLADALFFLGDADTAASHAEDALGMRLELFGPSHVDVARSRTQVGRIYVKLNRLSDAQGQLLDAGEVTARIQGPDSLAMADITAALSEVYVANGNFKEADIEFKRTLAITRKVHGEEGVALIEVYDRYADSLTLRGKHKESLESREKALAISRAVHGEDSVAALSFQAQHARSLALAGQSDDARGSADQAFEKLKSLPGEVDPDRKAWAYIQLSHVYMVLDDMPKASAVINGIASLSKAGKYPDRTLVDSLSNLAGLQLRMKKPKAAEKIAREAIAIAEKSPSLPRESLAGAHEMLGAALGNLEKHEEALEAFDTAYEIEIESRGDRHPALLRYMDRRAHCFEQLDRRKEAEEERTRAYIFAAKIFGADSANTNSYCYQLARLHEDAGRWERAIEYFDICTAYYEEHIGEHIATANLHLRIADCYQNFSEYPKSANHRRRAIEIYVALDMDKSVEVANEYNSLGVLYYKMANKRRALEYWEQALNRYNSLGLKGKSVDAVRTNVEGLRKQFKGR